MAVENGREFANRLRRRSHSYSSDLFWVLRNPVFLLLVGSGIMLLPFASVDPKRVIFALASAALAASFLDGLMRPTARWHWKNEPLPDRIVHWVNFLCLAKVEVVIVSGCLHAALFDDHRVLSALDRVPDRVRFKVYLEREGPEGSKEFRAKLVERFARGGRVEFYMIEVGQMPHGAVIDSRHCKVEEFGVPDATPNKYVDYYAFDPDRSRKVLRKIARVSKTKIVLKDARGALMR